MQKQMRYMAENILTDQIATVEQYFEEIEQIANSVIYNKSGCTGKIISFRH